MLDVANIPFLAKKNSKKPFFSKISKKWNPLKKFSFLFSTKPSRFFKVMKHAEHIGEGIFHF
jgi:hypothetical protein